MKKNNQYFLTQKHQGKKITVLTCYDYPTAVLEDRAGIDIILVGDSVGTNILGYKSEQEVTLDDIIHHLKAVHRGVSDAYILADLPYNTYNTPKNALHNAQKLIANGADGVKLEGLKPEVVTHLLQHNIEVCGHLGLQPQFHQQKTYQGKTFSQAKTIIEQALTLESLGVLMLLFELIPEELGKIITEKVKVPTIGIGAGRFTDGQVLVVNDVLGITPFKLKIAKQYQAYQDLTLQAINQYKQEVENLQFPSSENVRRLSDTETEKLKQWVEHYL